MANGGKRTRRGRASQEKKEKQFRRWVESGGFDRAKERAKEGLRENKTLCLEEFPTDFVGIKRKQDIVRTVTATKFTTNFASFPTIQGNTNILLKGPGGMDKDFILGLFANVVSPRAPAVLMKKWVALQRTKPQHQGCGDKNRSSTQAFHFGTWSIYMKEPILTRDTRVQSPETIAAMDDLLKAVKAYLLVPMKRILMHYFPEDWKRRQRAYEVFKQKLQADYTARPATDFKGIASTIAIKEGGSEIAHTDVNDVTHARTFVYMFGRFSGGRTVFPQVGVTVKPTVRQLVAANTKHLSHFSEPVEGQRVVITIFFEHVLMLRNGAEQ